MLTKSKTCSAPVLWCRDNLGKGVARALVVNSGNANAFTGKKGAEATRMTAEAAAAAVGCAPDEVYVSSTGVIGEPLDAGKFAHLLAGLATAAKPERLARRGQGHHDHRHVPEARDAHGEAWRHRRGHQRLRQGCRHDRAGSGDHAVYIFTDAAVDKRVLQEMLSAGADTTFNASPSTAIPRPATRCCCSPPASRSRAGRLPSPLQSSPEGRKFAAALHDLMHELALWVVKDGEGLTKLIRIDVTGAENDAAARRIGFSIANSPLVKTAVAGGDPNWGRVVMAVGKAGEAADRDRLSITYGDIQVAKDGGRAPTYDEQKVAAYMEGREIAIRVDLGLGAGKATVWTCDLTHDYISINADYRS